MDIKVPELEVDRLLNIIIEQDREIACLEIDNSALYKSLRKALNRKRKVSFPDSIPRDK